MAGPAPDQHEPEPESDTRLQLTGVPADADVSNFRQQCEFQIVFDSLKYQDPLHTLLEYISEVSIPVGPLHVRIPP